MKNLSLKVLDLFQQNNDKKFRKIYSMIKIHQSLINAEIKISDECYTILGYVVNKITKVMHTSKEKQYYELIQFLVENGSDLNKAQKISSYNYSSHLTIDVVNHSILFLSYKMPHLFQYLFENGAKLLEEEVANSQSNIVQKYEKLYFEKSIVPIEKKSKSMKM